MSKCFICKYPDARDGYTGVFHKCSCKFCGEYGLDESLHNELVQANAIPSIENGILQRIELEEFYLKAPGIAAERKLKGMDGYLLVYDKDLNSWQDDTKNSFIPIGIRAFLTEYPQDAIDMFNRTLANLGRIITHPAKKFEVNDQQNEKGVFPYFYSSDLESFVEIRNQLEKLGWIETVRNSRRNIDISITPKGWLTLRELKPSGDSDKAFVAMWFSKETQSLRNAVREAVNQAGYICDVVDEIHHNDYIMDKVLNLIKDSRFVIADFTSVPEDIEEKGKIPGGVRGGVYYEAGFAKGLGRPVIVSCREDTNSKARIHFDIAQLSTIFWKQSGDKLTTINDFDFVEFMKERIIATVGKGKHYKV